MKLIKDNLCPELRLKIDEDGDLRIYQGTDLVFADKIQAKELLEFLEGFLKNEQ